MSDSIEGVILVRHERNLDALLEDREKSFG